MLGVNMLVLKLRRTGKKHQPSYRLVVAEKRSKSDGQYLEGLGWYNPQNKQHQFNQERISHWLKNGAQKTDTVHNLLVMSGIIKDSKISVHIKAPIKEKGVVNEADTKNQPSVSEGSPEIKKVDQNNNQQQETKMDEMNPMMPGEEEIETAPTMPAEGGMDEGHEGDEMETAPTMPAEDGGMSEEAGSMSASDESGEDQM